MTDALLLKFVAGVIALVCTLFTLECDAVRAISGKKVRGWDYVLGLVVAAPLFGCAIWAALCVFYTYKFGQPPF